MKTRLTSKTKKVASALLTTMVICSILSIFVLYYLALIDQQAYLNARSQTWNSAIAVSEAGVEDGLEQLNVNYPNLGNDGWTYDSSSVCYWRSNSLPDGNGYTSYIFITNAMNPVVVARAYVTMPPKYATASPAHMFAVVGQNASTAPVTRAIMVTCSKNSLFLGAMVAKKTIDLNGNNVTTDSYDSSNTAKSTNGQYDPSKYKGDHGDIGTDQALVNSLSVGNANIYGHAYTGPGSQSNAIQVGANGVVGTHAWAASNSGLEPGYWSPDANYTFPDTTMPNMASYLTPTNGTMVLNTLTTVTNTLGFVGNTNVIGTIGSYKKNGTWYYYAQVEGTTTNSYDQIVWGPGQYVVGTAGRVLVVGQGATLAVTNGLSGSEQFTMYSDAWRTNNGWAPACPNSGVTVYAGGTSTSISGNNVMNQPGYPADFIVFCAPTVTSFTFNGNAGFNGVLVAPNVDLTMNGGGSNTLDFSGAIMANSITLNGHFNFHYDESLANMKDNGRFLITAWNEIN